MRSSLADPPYLRQLEKASRSVSSRRRKLEQAAMKVSSLGAARVILCGSTKYRAEHYADLGAAGSLSLDALTDTLRSLAKENFSDLTNGNFSRPADLAEAVLLGPNSPNERLFIYYLGYAELNDAHSIGLAQPTSVPGRMSTHIDLEDLARLARRYDRVVILLDVQSGLSRSGMHRALRSVAKGFRQTLIIVNQRDQGPHSRFALAFADALSNVWRTAPYASIRQLASLAGYVFEPTETSISLLAVGDCSQLDETLYRHHGGSLWQRDRGRLASDNQGSREDAVNDLRPRLYSARDRGEARTLLSWVADADPSRDVRGAAERLLSSSHKRSLGDSLSSDKARRRTQARSIRRLVSQIEALWCCIPAGSAKFGSDPGRDSMAQREELPGFSLFIPAYQIQRVEISRAHWLVYCVNTGHALPPGESVAAMRRRGDFPVVGVSWYEAVEFTEWLTEASRAYGVLSGKESLKLPTEIQWEKAARGTRGRLYPWGRLADPTRANYRDSSIGRVVDSHAFSPRGHSPFGVADMAGNVWEWTRSLWGPRSDIPRFKYPYDASDGRENEAAPEDIRRVIRGGAYYYFDWCLRAATRNAMYPTTQHSAGGFRVVREDIYLKA